MCPDALTLISSCCALLNSGAFTPSFDTYTSTQLAVLQRKRTHPQSITKGREQFDLNTARTWNDAVLFQVVPVRTR